MPRAYRLPVGLRAKLAKPMGRLFKAAEIAGPEFGRLVTDAPMVVTVGDKVTETVGAMGRVPDVQVVDSLENRRQRTPPDVPFGRRIPVKNPPATITEEAIAGIREAIRGRKPARVAVDGEEDLLAIPAIASAPHGSTVYYGQPGVGVVLVTVDERARRSAGRIMASMGRTAP